MGLATQITWTPPRPRTSPPCVPRPTCDQPARWAPALALSSLCPMLEPLALDQISTCPYRREGHTSRPLPSCTLFPCSGTFVPLLGRLHSPKPHLTLHVLFTTPILEHTQWPTKSQPQPTETPTAAGQRSTRACPVWNQLSCYLYPIF